jgi:hypothetical protein
MSYTLKPAPIPVTRQYKHSRTKEDRVLRPKNAFILFRSDFYAAQRRISSYQGQNEISRQAARAWHRLSYEEKRPYNILAEREKREHQAKYPNYVYTPGIRQRVGAGGIKNKRKPRVRFHSEELESPPSSPFPTRLSPESERADSCAREASPVFQARVAETPEPELVATKSESLSPADFNLGWAFIPTENIPPLELSAPRIEKVRVFAT